MLLNFNNEIYRNVEAGYGSGDAGNDARSAPAGHLDIPMEQMRLNKKLNGQIRKAYGFYSCTNVVFLK